MRLASNLELCIPPAPECWDININVHHVKSFTGSEELLAGEVFVQLSEYSVSWGRAGSSIFFAPLPVILRTFVLLTCSYGLSRVMTLLSVLLGLWQWSPSLGAV